MITQDYKAEIVPRELQTISLVDSRLWYRVQWLIKILFCNLGLIALFPYLVSDNLFPFYSSSIDLWSMVFWLVLVAINLIFLIIFLRKPFTPKYYEITCKQGIWKLTEPHSLDYARLAGNIIVWQWIILIKLYLPAQKRRMYVVILNDSISPQDRARLRRWLMSEFI